MRRTSGRMAMTGVLVLLGFLVVIQLRSQAESSGLNALSVQELGELVGNVTTRNDQLRVEIRDLERQHETMAAAARNGDTSAGQIRADLNRVLGWSGAVGVIGPGVRVTIDGSLPGDAIQLLTNELRNAGAEAIAIDGIRVVAGVVVAGPAGDLAMAGAPLADPVELLAIGQPDALLGSLSRSGGSIAQLGARFPGATVTVSRADRLTLPATDRDLAPSLGHPRL